MSKSASVWGTEIAVEQSQGVPYKMYVQRPRSIRELLAFGRRWGDRPHVVQGERVIRFDALTKAVSAKAKQLRALGVSGGDRVFILGWNSPEWIANFWACVKVGAVPVLANGWWSEGELSNSLNVLRPFITLADTHGAAKMPAGSLRAPWECDFQSDVVDDSAEESSNEETPAAIIFTSGTSGVPKAVVLSHRALLAGLHMLLHVTRRLPHQLDEAATDVGLHTGPLFHVGGVQTLLRAVTVGSTLVMPRSKFDPGEALELIEHYRIGRWAAVPTMVSRLLDHPDVKRRDLSSLRSVTVGGAPVHAELMRRIGDALPSVAARIPTGYGLTENGGQATAASGADTADRPGSSGKALPCVELAFRQLPGLPDGEILLRSPTQMSCYFGVADSPIDEEGWLHTGDLGRLDDKGNLWITGRSKDMIIRGGENIAPVAVERALSAIPGVSEAVVFGVPHTDLGEEVMAIVVVETDLTADELRDKLRATLSSFAVPSRWRIQKEPLATNHSGKIDKPVLAAQARAELAEERARASA
jgi:acyl-CoA synthetase (AMP-forming)/AMP-acid ligase II